MKKIITILTLVMAIGIAYQTSAQEITTASLVAETKLRLQTALKEGKAADAAAYSQVLMNLTAAQYVEPLAQLSSGISAVVRTQFASQLESVPDLLGSALQQMQKSASTPTQKAFVNWLLAKDKDTAKAAAIALPVAVQKQEEESRAKWAKEMSEERKRNRIQ